MWYLWSLNLLKQIRFLRKPSTRTMSWTSIQSPWRNWKKIEPFSLITRSLSSPKLTMRLSVRFSYLENRFLHPVICWKAPEWRYGQSSHKNRVIFFRFNCICLVLREIFLTLSRFQVSLFGSTLLLVMSFLTTIPTFGILLVIMKGFTFTKATVEWFIFFRCQ